MIASIQEPMFAGIPDSIHFLTSDLEEEGSSDPSKFIQAS